MGAPSRAAAPAAAACGLCARSILLAVVLGECGVQVFSLAEYVLGSSGRGGPPPGEHAEAAAAAERRLLDSDQLLALNLGLRLGIPLFMVLAAAISLWCYWRIYIRPTAKQYLPQRAVILQDLQGRWQHDVFDCADAWSTCCCFIWCSHCMMGELWYRAGWLHVAAEDFLNNGDDGTEGSCPGWPFFIGACGSACLSESGCIYPFVLAALRGSLPSFDLGNIVAHRKRFAIPAGDAFCQDCCLWCWCGPCMGTQEYRQVMAVLSRGPVEVAAPQPAMVVGMPVQVNAGTNEVVVISGGKQ